MDMITCRLILNDNQKIFSINYLKIYVAFYSPNPHKIIENFKPNILITKLKKIT